MKCDFLIVGAGFAGAVIAERLASQLNQKCLVIDKRHHIGGNAYDHYDEHGILIHTYGPHYFRTNSPKIKDYLGQFTDWHEVEYKILSWTDGKFWNFPINLNTFEQILGRPSSEEEMIRALNEWKVPIENPKNSEEVIVSQVGWKLYEMFFKNYTKKQWQRDPKDLDASVCGRIPIRTNRDNRYLVEEFQALPKEGYTKMFEKILNHPNIEVKLNTDYKDLMGQVEYKHLIFTGMIDEFYNYQFGRLPYRSLRFEVENHPVEFYQPSMQVNYPNDFDYTRIVEIKHATGQKASSTTIVKEYPQDYGPDKEAFYPIPAPDTKKLYEQYAALAEKEEKVSFIGRLATYRYYNMDQIVGMALTEFEKLAKRTNLN